MCKINVFNKILCFDGYNIALINKREEILCTENQVQILVKWDHTALLSFGSKLSQ